MENVGNTEVKKKHKNKSMSYHHSKAMVINTLDF